MDVTPVYVSNSFSISFLRGPKSLRVNLMNEISWNMQTLENRSIPKLNVQRAKQLSERKTRGERASEIGSILIRIFSCDEDSFWSWCYKYYFYFLLLASQSIVRDSDKYLFTFGSFCLYVYSSDLISELYKFYRIIFN